MFPFIVSLLAVVLLSLFQLTSYSFIDSIKPDLALVFLIFFSYLRKDWLERVALIFSSALIFKFGLGFELENALFIIAVFLGIWVLERVPAPLWLNLGAAVLVATSVANLNNYQPETVLWESLYNLALTEIFYFIYILWRK